MPNCLKDKGSDKSSWGRFGRLLWTSHLATLLTNPTLNSDTTSTIIHPEADRPLTVREYARVQVGPGFTAGPRVAIWERVLHFLMWAAWQRPYFALSSLASACLPAGCA